MSLLIPGTNSIKDTGYNVSNSLRFDDASNDWLSKTFSSSGNRQKQTISVWIKRCNLAASSSIFSVYYTGSIYANFYFNGSDQLQYFNNGGSINLTTTRLFRDNSSWYHILLKLDTTDSTADDRIKMYVNGVQETSFAARTNPGLNAEVTFGDNYAHYIGTYNNGASDDFDGYMSQFVFTTNVAYGPDSFGETDSDSGIWIPKEIDGLTFNTNAFFLDFEDSSTLGNDVSGNNNDFTANNLTAIDQSTDTCTNNFATLNPLYHYIGGAALSEGNLKFTTSGNSSVGRGMSTIRPESGKWYVECKIIDVTRFSFGLMNGNETNSSQGGENTNSVIFDYVGGFYMAGGFSGYLSAPSNNDIVQLALDLDNDLFWIGINDTWGNSATRTEIENGTATNDATTFISSQVPINTGAIGIFVEDNSSTGNNVAEINFGNPTFSISSGNADANGYGNFEYAVPSGYYALCTKNLAEFG